MRVSGNEYKVSTGVILDVEHDLPVVGIIQDIYIVNEDKVIISLPLHMNHIFERTLWKMILVQELFVIHIDLFILLCLSASHVCQTYQTFLFYPLLFVHVISSHFICI